MRAGGDASAHEDALLSRVYQQIAEVREPHFAAGYDLRTGVDTYQAWLGEHTEAAASVTPAAEGGQTSTADVTMPLRAVVTQPGEWNAELAAIELYSLQYKALVPLAAVLVRDTSTAEELVPDAFIAMHDGWHRLKDVEKALAYLRQAVVNKSRSVLRHRMVVEKNVTDLQTALFAAAVCCLAAADIEGKVTHGYADSNGVKIHYASLGKGPLVVMIHGFPDYWYTWRDQMQALSGEYQCVAIDQRGYNLSDKPQGVENYDVKYLVGDVIAVIKALGRDKAIIVGHDWGGVVAWSLAMSAPQYVDKLVILNLPHPRGSAHELATDPEQQKNSAYARGFQQPEAASKIKPEQLAFWVKDPEARAKYVGAFKRSDVEAMLNYYKRNYPKEPYREDTSPVVKVKAPVLEFHGLKDTALNARGLNNTWEYLEKDWTLVTVPDAGHFVQQDASELVSRTMLSWLKGQAEVR